MRGYHGIELNTGAAFLIALLLTFILLAFFWIRGPLRKDPLSSPVELCLLFLVLELVIWDGSIVIQLIPIVNVAYLLFGALVAQIHESLIFALSIAIVASVVLYKAPKAWLLVPAFLLAVPFAALLALHQASARKAEDVARTIAAENIRNTIDIPSGASLRLVGRGWNLFDVSEFLKYFELSHVSLENQSYHYESGGNCREKRGAPSDIVINSHTSYYGGDVNDCAVIDFVAAARDESVFDVELITLSDDSLLAPFSGFEYRISNYKDEVVADVKSGNVSVFPLSPTWGALCLRNLLGHGDQSKWSCGFMLATSPGDPRILVGDPTPGEWHYHTELQDIRDFGHDARTRRTPFAVGFRGIVPQALSLKPRNLGEPADH